jgi:hypothetical protein
MRSRRIFRFLVPLSAVLSAVVAGGAWFRY